MPKRISLFLLLLISLVGSGCSSDSEPTDSTGPVVIPGTGGGIGGSGYTRGTLTRVGSVFINGLHFDTTSAEFHINGQTSNQDQLQVGMQLTAQVNFETSTAHYINYTSSIIGPIESPPDTMDRMVVLNQSVRINGSTILDSLTLPDLRAGQRIEMSGWSDANGDYLASYIRPAPDSNQIQLVGAITDVADNQPGFSVGGVTVLIAQADSDGLSIQDLTPGLSVVVSATADNYDPSTTTLIASAIASTATITVDEDTKIEINGLVQSFTSTESFTLDGVPIVTNDQTRFESVESVTVNPSSVSLNSLLEIEGSFSANGTLVARKIIVLPNENSKFVGQIEALDTVTNSLTMFGLPIRTTALTRYRGDGNLRVINFSALRVGDYVEVEATFATSSLVANKIELEEPDDETILEGPVTEVIANLGSLKIMGVAVVFGDDTEFEIGNDGAEQQVDQITFLEQVAEGTLVKAKWKEFISIIQPVDDIELE